MKKLIFLLLLVPVAVFANTPAKEDSDFLSYQEKVSIYQNEMRRIELYLDRIKTFVATFEQIDEDGNKATGTFYLDRPGKLRWEYDPPSPILIVAKGSLLAYYDKELDEVSHVVLDNLLAGFLTKAEINFSRGVEIVEFSKDSDSMFVTIVQKDKKDQGSLTMGFSHKPELRYIEILDAVGRKTKIEFGTIVYDKPLSKKLFKMPKIQKKRP